MSGPTPSRPHMPGYLTGAKSRPGEKMPWSRVEELLKTSRNYWICTTWPGGRPHTAPVWGIWADGAFQFSTGAGTRKAKNLAEDPRTAVHVEAMGEAVILDRIAEEFTDIERLTRFVEIYNPKYGWDFAAHDLAKSGGVYAVRPEVVFSFTEELAETATRWRFSGD